MANEEMKMYYRVTKVYCKINPAAKYAGEEYATHKPQPTRRVTSAYVFIDTFYESKELAEKAIRLTYRID